MKVSTYAERQNQIAVDNELLEREPERKLNAELKDFHKAFGLKKIKKKKRLKFKFKIK